MVSVVRDPSKVFADYAITQATYVVFKRGSVTYVKDGESGEIVYSSLDDASAIQFAINKANDEGGGRVYVKRGEYVINSTINLLSNVVLVGEGVSTHLSTNKDIRVLLADDVENIVVSDLFISGDGDANKTNQTAVRLDYGKYAVIERLRIDNMGYDGIEVQAASEAIVTHNVVSNCKDDGIGANGLTGEVIFANNISFNNGYSGIHIDVSSQYVMIANNMAYSNGDYGIECVRTSGTGTKYSVMVGNVVKGNKNGGIRIRGVSGDQAKYWVVSSNVSRVNGYGISLDSAQYCTVIGNMVTGNNNGGIWIGGDSDDNLIIGNYVVNNSGDGIRIPVSTAERNIIIQNVVTGNTGAQLYNAGTNTIIKGNIGYFTEKSGIATLSSGSTRTTVTHGLSATPTKVLVTPYGNIKVWVENITSTSFDIVTDASPSQNITVAWYAEV